MLHDARHAGMIVKQFASALEELSALISYDGGELQDVYESLSDQFAASQTAAADVSSFLLAGQ